MEFGVFHEFVREAGQSEADAFSNSFDVVDKAERWGLDVVWLAEQHFASFSVLASPLAIASAIAARTDRLKIGTAVQVLPLGNPLRLAEEWATVDHLSQGRLIFGVGRSGFPRVYQSYGISYAESRERFAEALAIIKKAWTEPSFSYQGQYYQYENVSVTPKPYQQPLPPIRVAAITPDTFPALGAQGYPLFAGVRQETFSKLLPDLEAYRAAYRKAGHPGEGAVYLRVPIYVAKTMGEALAVPEQSIMSVYHNMAKQLIESAATAATPYDAEVRAERGHRLAQLTYEQARQEKVVVGTPEAVIERLHELRGELGIDGILAELNPGRQIPHEHSLRSLELLCTEIMPHFR
jgi:alkanesulfonate monooxygenase SsuD/methylene tetrahydromethanopterin reductase-like flavin-dependent oxidoreductase (luciferase family)